MNRALLVLALAGACNDDPLPAARKTSDARPQLGIMLLSTGETKVAHRGTDGALTPRDQIAAALGAPAEGEPRVAGSSTHGRLRATASPVEVQLFVDAGTSAADVVDVLDKASPRTVAVTLTSSPRTPLPYAFAPIGVSHAAPVPIDVTPDGITLYGNAVAWSQVPAELAQLVEGQRATTSMSLSAALTVARDVDVERLGTVLRAAADAGFVEVDLAIDTAPAPVIATTSTAGWTGAVPTVSIGQPSVSGDLDKAIVRRYIKRNIQKITYCYEKQVLATPSIGGTLVATFTILASGITSGSKASGVHTAVSACVAGVVGSIEFPKPKGGGVVLVSFPFTFHLSGG